MRTIVSFPICDLRRLTGDTDKFIDQPSWSAPELGKDFVRALGGIKDATLSGIDIRGLTGWIAEPVLCDIVRGPKFHDMPAMQVGGFSYQLKVLRRSLYFDGRCSARVEYVFEIDVIESNNELTFELINEFICNLKLKIRQHEGERSGVYDDVDFGRSGLLHARALASRTIRKNEFDKIHDIRKLIKYRRPSIIHTFLEDEKIEIGDNFTSVKNNTSKYFDIYHDRINIFGNIDVPIWIIKLSKKYNKRDLRDFTLYLRRLHCEYECLKTLFKEIERGTLLIKDNTLSVKVEEYLLEVLTRVGVAERILAKPFKFAPSEQKYLPEIAELASVSIHDLDPSLIHQIRTALEQVKFNWQSNQYKALSFMDSLEQKVNNVQMNVEVLNMDNRQTVNNSSGVTLTQAGGDAKVKVDATFNAFQEKTSDTDLVQAVADLKRHLEQLIDDGDVSDPKVLARDFEELSTEVTSENPRKAKIEFNGKMILGAIKESSGLISSVTKAIEIIKSFC